MWKQCEVFAKKVGVLYIAPTAPMVPTPMHVHSGADIKLYLVCWVYVYNDLTIGWWMYMLLEMYMTAYHLGKGLLESTKRNLVRGYLLLSPKDHVQSPHY